MITNRIIKNCLRKRHSCTISNQSLNDAKRIVIRLAGAADKGWVTNAIHSMDQSVINAGFSVGGRMHLGFLDIFYLTLSIHQALQPAYQYDWQSGQVIHKILVRRLKQNQPNPIIFKYVGHLIEKRNRVYSQNMISFGYGFLLEESNSFLRRGWYEYHTFNPFRQILPSDFLPRIIPKNLSSHELMQLSRELLASRPVSYGQSSCTGAVINHQDSLLTGQPTGDPRAEVTLSTILSTDT